MRPIRLCLSLLAAVLVALALSVLSVARAEDPSAADTKVVQPAEWGVTIALNAHGDFSQAGDPGWELPDLDFVWSSTNAAEANYPIYRIEGMTFRDDKRAAIAFDDEQYGKVFDQMSQLLAADASTKLLDSSATVTIGKHVWQMFKVEETQPSADSATAQPIDYCFFYTRDANRVLHGLSFYYSSADSTAAYGLAQTILGSIANAPAKASATP